MAFDDALGAVVLFGGRAAGQRMNDTWLYRGTAWLSGPSAPPGMLERSSHAMAYDSRRKCVVLFSGQQTNYTFHKDVWEYQAAVPTP